MINNVDWCRILTSSAKNIEIESRNLPPLPTLLSKLYPFGPYHPLCKLGIYLAIKIYGASEPIVPRQWSAKDFRGGGNSQQSQRPILEWSSRYWLWHTHCQDLQFSKFTILPLNVTSFELLSVNLNSIPSSAIHCSITEPRGSGTPYWLQHERAHGFGNKKDIF